MGYKQIACDNCMLWHHRVGKAFEQQPFSIRSVFVMVRQRPPLDKVSSCQGGYAPPSLGVRVALWVTHALGIGTMSALMLVMHVEKE